MKAFLLFVFFLTTFQITAQKIEKYYDYAWHPTEDIGRARYYALIEKKDSLWQRSDYFIREKKLQMFGSYRDEENKIAVGHFDYYYANGFLESTGEYVNGKKHGLWLQYHENGMMRDSSFYDNGNIVGISQGWHRNGYPADSLVYNNDGSGMGIFWFDNGNPSSAGRYAAGRKMHGRWQFFHQNGNLSSLEVYDTGNLLSKQYFDEAGKEIKDTTSKDTAASFPGGQKAWAKYLQKNLYFPSQWKLSNTDQVIITVDWVIDEEGNISNVFVSAPFHPDFDKIAVNVISKSPKWNPAISHNRKIKAYRRQPVTFSQE